MRLKTYSKNLFAGSPFWGRRDDSPRSEMRSTRRRLDSGGSKQIRWRFVATGRVALIGLLLLSILSCRPKGPSSATASELTVSAAVSLKDAFNEIAELNEKRNGTRTHFNYGASGALQKQIESGAPADVFASAGAKQMDELAAKDLLVRESRRDFACNSLILIVPAKSANLGSFTDLANPSVNRVAVGNPKTVPAGQYTEQTLNKLGLLPAIQTKLIFAEDVRQVLDYVVRDEVDAGVVYASDALSSGDQIKVVARAPDDSHDQILYPVAIVKDSKQQEAARKFIDLVLSSEGQTILAKHGFLAMK
jgi:molybdate transport system substrate-binding protein